MKHYKLGNNNEGISEYIYSKAFKAGQSYNWKYLYSENELDFFECQDTKIVAFVINPYKYLYWCKISIINKQPKLYTIYEGSFHTDAGIIIETKQTFIIKDIIE